MHKLQYKFIIFKFLTCTNLHIIKKNYIPIPIFKKEKKKEMTLCSFVLTFRFDLKGMDKGLS